MPRPTFGSRIASAVLAVALLGVAGFVVGPHVFGYRTLTVLSGSMEPAFGAGDVIVVVPTRASALRVGDIVTFHPPTVDAAIVTHRIESIEHPGSQHPVIRTKGDANDGADPWRVRLSEGDAWRQVTVIPVVGTLMRVAHGHRVVSVAILGLPIVLLLLVLVDVWRPRHEDVDLDQDDMSDDMDRIFDDVDLLPAA